MTILTIIFAILLFSLLIFVHELGHFMAAKLSGVQVNEFALFMGPAIYKKKAKPSIPSAVFLWAATAPWKARMGKGMWIIPVPSRKQPGGSG